MVGPSFLSIGPTMTVNGPPLSVGPTEGLESYLPGIAWAVTGQAWQVKTQALLCWQFAREPRPSTRETVGKDSWGQRVRILPDCQGNGPRVLTDVSMPLWHGILDLATIRIVKDQVKRMPFHMAWSSSKWAQSLVWPPGPGHQ